MDAFDDLLNPSANPFQDPFEKRSGSPDPWSTPFGEDPFKPYGSSSSQQQPEQEEQDSTRAPTSPTVSTTSADPLASSQVNLEEPSSPTSAVKPPNSPEKSKDNSKGPLDIPDDEEDEEDNKPLGHLRKASLQQNTVPPSPSKGFRESKAESSPSAPASPSSPASLQFAKPAASPTSSTFNETLTIRQEPVEESQISPREPDTQHKRGSSAAEVAGPLGVRQTPVAYVPPSNNTFSGGGFGGGLGWGASDDDQEAWGGAPSTTSVPPTPDDDSEDDKPIGQIVQSRVSASGSPAPVTSPKRKNELPPVFEITVDDPQKVGDPIRSYTMYTVHTRTTSPLFQKSSFSVLRRYSDFLWLYETLSLNNPGVIVPPVPEKNPFGRFDDTFVRQRRFALEKCMQKTANHPLLMKDPDLKFFLESDNFSLDIKQRKAELAHERGSSGLLGSIGSSLTGPRFYENDEWFDRQKSYLDSLESQLRGLVKAIELVAKHRIDLSTATGEFSITTSDLSQSDVGKELAVSLGGLADVQKKAQDLQTKQTESDMVTFMATADEYARLINSVRMAFSSRIRSYYTWKQAENDLTRIKQSRPTQTYSVHQLGESERRALDSRHEFENASKLIKQEMARFERERVEDFKNSLQVFLDGMIERQKELIEVWENYQSMLLKRVQARRAAQGR